MDAVEASQIEAFLAVALSGWVGVPVLRTATTHF